MDSIFDLLGSCRVALDGLDDVLKVGAGSIGATLAVFKLFVSLLVAYPLAFIYRCLRPHVLRTAFRRNLYFAATGLALCLLNFQLSALHSVLSILVTYSLARFLTGTGLAVVLGLVFHVTYLTAGYASVASEKYDVTWTTAQCVLCLRHVGLLFDLWDGRRISCKKDAGSSTAYPAPLQRPPTLVELVAHTYFFGGFLVGPQFPMSRYLDFIADFSPDTKLRRSADPDVAQVVSPTDLQYPGSSTALLRLFMGLLYVAAFQGGSVIVPQSYMLSYEFLVQSSFLYRMTYILLWGKIVLYKYVGTWLIAEGSCILTGLTYNGLDENGNVLWNSCANIEIGKYESVDTFRGVIASFNINTNKWVQNYIFKRLRFMGSKALSAISSLFFLALWHGVFSGYFMCFALEFLIVKFETDILEFKNKIPAISRLWRSLPAYLRFLIGKWFTLQFLGYALVSFCLLSLPRWTTVYASVYYVGHVLFASWLFVGPLVKLVLRPGKVDAKAQ